MAFSRMREILTRCVSLKAPGSVLWEKEEERKRKKGGSDLLVFGISGEVDRGAGLEVEGLGLWL